jgi:hypothetical protein
VAAVVQRTSGVTFNADAIVRATTSTSISIDASIRDRLGFTINAAIRSLSEFSFRAAAVITKRRPKRIRARIVGSGITARISAATLGATVVPTHTISARLSAATFTATVAAGGTNARLDVVFPSFTVAAVIV